MKQTIFFIFVVLALFLAACNPARSQVETTAPTTPPQLPTTTETPPVPPQKTATDQPPAQMPIVYYYFVAIASNTFPAGSVVILPDVLILAPTLSKTARSPDPITNISSALQAMINDPRNAWKGADLGITSITFKDGNSNVVLHGEIQAAGDIVLIAARMQILMTVFAEAAVQSATVTLNGNNIANLGISHESEARPAGYAYSRAEIETFISKNAFRP